MLSMKIAVLYDCVIRIRLPLCYSIYAIVKCGVFFRVFCQDRSALKLKKRQKRCVIPFVTGKDIQKKIGKGKMNVTRAENSRNPLIIKMLKRFQVALRKDLSSLFTIIISFLPQTVDFCTKRLGIITAKKDLASKFTQNFANYRNITA
ncbi:hypothetical protein [Avibacterium volantium]|uniref:Uncharacterized protein n=1 Tax=Avibacterium volantium TaxID=762 RepID=A0A447SNN3_AVIVO|nr:hypothetical protein [Avibacterium volantium]VEB21899.1 Uncharacterised protein [Avibacterium volantium]